MSQAVPRINCSQLSSRLPRYTHLWPNAFGLVTGTTASGIPERHWKRLDLLTDRAAIPQTGTTELKRHTAHM